MKKIGYCNINLNKVKELLGPDYIKFEKEYRDNIDTSQKWRACYNDQVESDSELVEYCKNILINSKEFEDIKSKLYSYDTPTRLFIKDKREDVYLNLKEIESNKDLYSVKYDLYYTDERVSIIEYFIEYSYIIFIPTSFLENIELLKDYSDTPISLLVDNTKGAIKPINQLALSNDITLNTVSDSIVNKMGDIDKAKSEIKKARKEKEEEINRIKQEIESKYSDILAELDKKTMELELQKENLQNQLFVIETQIYSIRCFYGETIQFNKIVSGKNASDDEPVVLYQKMRFIGEEMSKYASIYDFSDESKDKDMLEKLIMNNETFRNFIMPEGRSISLAKISEDGRIYVAGTKTRVDGKGRNASLVISNVMESYKKFHGNKIAIFIRNGDNCYIGWTDQDKISIDDDNVFLKQEVTVKPADNEDDENKLDIYKRYEEERKKELRKEANQIASRYFIFSILQGVSINSDIMPVKDADFFNPDGKNIIFSLADNWLEDSTYGTYSDIIEKTFKYLKKGDNILTLSSLSAEGRKYDAFENDRGIGYLNRTHDVHCESNTVYPINLIKEEEIIVTYYNTPRSNYRYSTIGDGHNLSSDCTNVETVNETKYSYYISLKKEYGGRANFEVLKDEFINLTFLNSEYIKYLIFNKKSSAYIVGNSSVNFSYMMPYLNHALEFLKEREIEESKLLKEVGYDTNKNDNWIMDLSNWRLENDIHFFTITQAKKFKKFMETK